MPVRFEGEWLLEVVERDAAFDQRFVVVGSIGSDGVYPGVVGAPAITVTGANWTVDFEWNDNAGSGWQKSAVRKNIADSTLSDGLVMILGVDDNRPEVRDNDFNDVVLRCRNLNRRLNPWVPFAGTLDFTLERKRGPADEDGGRPVDPRLPRIPIPGRRHPIPIDPDRIPRRPIPPR